MIGGRKVKVHFEAFDFGTGYNYDISLSSNDPELINLGDRYPKKGTQQAQWTLNKIEKNSQWDLFGVKLYASGIQKIFCLKS